MGKPTQPITYDKSLKTQFGHLRDVIERSLLLLDTIPTSLLFQPTKDEITGMCKAALKWTDDPYESESKMGENHIAELERTRLMEIEMFREIVTDFLFICSDIPANTVQRAEDLLTRTEPKTVESHTD